MGRLRCCELFRVWHCLDPNIAPETADVFKTHPDQFFICLELALDTTKKWKESLVINQRRRNEVLFPTDGTFCRVAQNETATLLEPPCASARGRRDQQKLRRPLCKPSPDDVRKFR